MNKNIKLNGLNCAACGTKIEESINKLPWIEEAKLNYSMSNINIKVKDLDKYSLKFIQKIVDEIEEGVSLYDENDQVKDISIFQNKGFIRLMISLPLFVAGLLLGSKPLIQAILLSTAYLISGIEVLIRAVKNMAKGRLFDEFFLMSIATIGAFLIGELAEGVGVMIFFQLGEFFQGLAIGKTKKSIKSLMSIKPDFARLDNGQICQPEAIGIGDVIEVRPGEKIPLDGYILTGNSSVDTKTITGESIPRSLKENDKVLSGFLNISGILKIKVEKTFSESTVSVILEMVQNEASKKTKTENFITKFSRVYTPIVVIAAMLIAIISPLLFKGLSFNESIYKSLIFLVISCPCALVVAVPLGYFSGIGRASKEGILIKGSTYIEALTEVTKFAFDKTGTLTKGVFSVYKTTVNNGFSKEDLLTAAYITESKSNHPIAKSVIDFCNLASPFEPDEYKEISGSGVIAVHKNKTYIAGKEQFLTDRGIAIEGPVKESGTKVFVAEENKHIGTLYLADSVKEGSKKLVKSLGHDNVYMLTGDNKDAADKVAGELEIKKLMYNLLPMDKADYIKNLSYKEKVLFVGDGINDAPVLAASHVGVSMGGLGSDAAIEASDVVIMNDDPSKVSTAVNISKYTKMIIIQNIVIALGFKVLIMLMGVMGFAGLWLAIFADVGVTLIAVLNSLRTLRKKF